MNKETKIFISFLLFSIKELETQLKELKPYLKDTTDFNDKLEYKKKLELIKELKKQVKLLKDGE